MSVLEKLRAPFPDHHISKLPKETKAQIDQRKSDRNSAFKCPVCGGWHHKQAVHLDYVGHAALTDRLLDTDLHWTWEPVAFNERGLPAFDQNGGLWIRLTVDSVTRLGYGSADGKSGGDAVKEIIGDALRNAAMRFGAALDLWQKGDLHIDEPEEPKPTPPPEKFDPPADKPTNANRPAPLTGVYKTRKELKAAIVKFKDEMAACDDLAQLETYLGLKTSKALTKQVQEEKPDWWEGDGADFAGLAKDIEHSLRMLEIADNDDSWKSNPLLGG